MPIVQHRVIDLIEAGEMLKQHLESILRETVDLYERFAANIKEQLDKDELDRQAFARIYDNLQNQAEMNKIRQPSVRAAEIIAREREHFRVTSRKNKRNQMYQQIRRRREGIEPRADMVENEIEEAPPTAPSSVIAAPIMISTEEIQKREPDPNYLAWKELQAKARVGIPIPKKPEPLPSSDLQSMIVDAVEGTNIPADYFDPKDDDEPEIMI